MAKLTKEERKELAWKEYLASITDAWMEYEEEKKIAMQKCQKILKPARDKYEEKCKEIDEENDRT